MANDIFDNSPLEPAHPRVVKLHDELIALYRVLREKYQKQIDEAFDRASRQVGFMVTTTVPWILEVGERGKVEAMGVGAEHLRGTIFERELAGALEGILGDSNPLPAGSFRIYLVWYEALKLKLRTEWIEPAHFRRSLAERLTPEPVPWRERRAQVQPEVLEPVHWFDPGTRIDWEERVLISVLDEVYPELKLVERLKEVRASALERWPGIREPAHFRRPELEREIPLERWPGIREPAHRGPEAELEKTAVEVLKEMADLLRRRGF